MTGSPCSSREPSRPAAWCRTIRPWPSSARDYAAHVAEQSRPFPGVTEFLRDHAEAGWGMAVCTNKPAAAARRLLDDMGLSDLLPAVGGGDSFPVRKPDPAHLLATLRLAGGDPAGSVMVGDHANDVAAAHGAGVKSIFVTWGMARSRWGRGRMRSPATSLHCGWRSRA